MKRDLSSKICICILLYNREDAIGATLDSIVSISQEYYIKIFLLDNNSTDRSLEIAESYSGKIPGLTLIRSDCNLGVSAGRNALYKYAGGIQFILSIDDDICITEASLLFMLSLAESNAHYGVISPAIYDTKKGCVLNLGRKKREFLDRFYEGSFLISKRTIEQVGYFDEKLPFAGEGLDYSIRCKKSGMLIKPAYHCCVLHNDRNRCKEDPRDRRLKWVYSFSYVYRKNYNVIFALLKVVYLVLSHVKNQPKPKSFKFTLRLIDHSIKGFFQSSSVNVSLE